jgi:hypothetical protein
MKDANTVPNTEVPSAEPEGNEGTTERLFGEPKQEASPGETTGAPNAAAEGGETPTPKPTSTPTEPVKTESLKLSDFSGKTVTTKVNGEEKEVSLEELRKGYQISETLTQRGQELGTQRQEIAAESKQLEALKAKVEGMVQNGVPQVQSQPTLIPGVDMDMLDEATKAALITERNERDSQMAQINETLKQLSVGLQPVQIEQAYKKIDKALRQENSEIYTDFMDKIPEIENAIMAMSVQDQAAYGGPLGYTNIYKDIKLREMTANPGGNNVPALVPNVEGGAGVPTGAGGESSKRAEQRKRAMAASSLKDIREGMQDDPLEAWAPFCE